MKRISVVSVCIVMLVSSIFSFSPVSKSSEEHPELLSVTFNEVYTNPQHPFGHDWTTLLGGDSITLYADVNSTIGLAYVNVTFIYSTRFACYPGEPGPLPSEGYPMNSVGGSLYSYAFLGDWVAGLSTYEAAGTTISNLQYQVRVEETDGSVTWYPPVSDTYIYPAWPPTQINSTSQASKTTLNPGETFWVNGTTNFWNSTSYPGNYSGLISVAESNVTISVNPEYYGKTDEYGNYSIEIAAPTTPGMYTINTTVSNSTSNRNVTCVCDEIQIEVLSTSGPVHNIDTDEYFTEIQTAIDDSDTLDGHTIEVDAGIYYENVMINKTISLIGEDRNTTIIDGNNILDVVRISADRVNLSGFTVMNSSNGPEGAGIELDNVSNCIVNDNLCINNEIGLNFAQNLKIIQVTQNNYDDYYPQININNEMCWQGDDGNDYEIFYWDGISITQITNNSYDDRDPRINDNGEICWNGGTTNDRDIYYWNGSSITKIRDTTYREYNNQINNNGHVVWRGEFNNIWSNGEIYYWDGVSITRITTNGHNDNYPQINDNNEICWRGDDFVECDVYYWNGTSTTLVTHSTDWIDLVHMNNNGELCWVDYDGFMFPQEIYYWNGTAVLQISTGSSGNSEPHINDNGEIWWTSNDGIHYWDGLSSNLIYSYFFELWPELQINNYGEICWEYDSEIYYWDGTSSSQITSSLHPKWSPQINDNSVMCWSGRIIDNHEIFITCESISSNNLIINNDISDNIIGIQIESASNNQIYHNNIKNNTIQATDDGTNNSWDNGYPSGGNYWSDYTGIDLNSTPTQDVPPPDGIGDTPYTDIQGGSGAQDNYPLMEPWGMPEEPPSTYNITLSSGWNLISLPLIQSNESIETVLASISGEWNYIQVYNATDPEPWKSYSIYNPDSLNEIGILDHKGGIWLHMLNATNLTIEGAEPVSTSISLYAGWNLVGYPSLTNETVANALWGTGADKVEVFDPGEPYRIKEVGPSYVMQPGEGYWIHVPADTTWIIDW